MKTHFEQVSLEIVKKIMEEQEKQGETTQLKYPKWQAPLQEAILEFDREKLRSKIESVETLVLRRLQELDLWGSGHSERQAIKAESFVIQLRETREVWKRGNPEAPQSDAIE